MRPEVGGIPSLILQARGVTITGAYAFNCALSLSFIIHKIIGFTVDETTEEEGLDVTQHGESAYRLV